MTVYHKPSGITKFMNGVLGWFAGVGLTPGHMIIIEARGRRSGQMRSAVINSVDYEGQAYLVSPRDRW